MKGFVISWFYPPINSSEGLVTFKLLNRSNYSYDVFTQKDNSLWSYNSSEHELKKDSIKTIFGNSESLEEWTKACVEYFDTHHEEYDFIMSRSMPPESHAAALQIKQKYPHIKWIASFGDPIYNSPYSKIAVPPLQLWQSAARAPHPKYFIALVKRNLKKQLWYYQTRGDRREETEKQVLENTTLRYADSVIFNNSYQKEFMLEQHKIEDKDGFVVIPHPFEKAFYEKRTPHANKKLTISHIGHLDWIRTPNNLLKAVKRIKDKRPELYEKLDVNFYGTLDNFSKIYIVDNNLFDSTHVHKPVTYFESLGIMQQSDWCLLVDANISSHSEKNIYFAAKLADYLGSGSPILAISMTDGASADIIRDTGNVLMSHSVDEIYMTLVMILEGKISEQHVASEIKKFDAKQTAKNFDALVETLIKT